MEFIFYTDRFIKDDSAGEAIGPFIFIRPSYRDDLGLLVHEQTHVKQCWRHFPIFGLLYRLFRHRRMEFEAEAYAAQAKCYPDDRVPRLARRLVECYDLGVSQEVAERAIRERM